MKKLFSKMTWLFPVSIIASWVLIAVFTFKVQNNLHSDAVLSERQAEINKLNDEILAKKIDLKKLEERVGLLKQDDAAIQQQIINIKKLKDEADARLSEEAKKKAEAEAQVVRAETLLEEGKKASKNMAAVQSKIAELQKLETALGKSIKMQEVQESALLASVKKLKTDKAGLENLQTQVTDLEQKKDSAEKSVSALDADVKKKSEDKASLEQELKALQGRKASLDKNIAAANATLDALNKLKGEIAVKQAAELDLKTSISTMKNKLSLLKEEEVAAEKDSFVEVKKLQDQENKLKASIKVLKGKEAAAVTDLQKYTTLVSSLKGDEQAMVTIIEKLKIAVAEDQAAAAKAKTAALNAGNEAAKAKAAAAKAKVEAAAEEKRLEDLKNKESN